MEIGLSLSLTSNKGVGGDVDPVGTLASINPYDADLVSRGYIPNRAAPRSLNMFQWPPGIVASFGSTVTLDYANDPQGALRAHRLQTAGNQGVTLATVPQFAGSVTLKIKLRSNTGGGSFTAQVGKFGTLLVPVAVTEAGWSDGVVTLDCSGGNTVVQIHVGAGIAADLLFANIQIYKSTDTIPAFTDEASSAMSLIATTAASPERVTKYGADSIVSPFAGRIKMSEDGISNRSFAAGTFITAFKKTASSPGFASVLQKSDYAFVLGLEGQLFTWICPGISARAAQVPGAWDGRQNKSYDPAGDDFVILGCRFDAAFSAISIEEIDVTTGAGTGGSPLLLPFLRAGGAGHQDAYPVTGAIGPTLILDTCLSGADYRAAVLSMKRRMRSYGEAVGLRNFMINEGDSITNGVGASGNGYAMGVSVSFSPFLKSHNFAVPGSALTALYTRLPNVLAMIAQAKLDGRRVIVTVMVGVNSPPLVTGAPGSDLSSYWTALRNAGATVVACTITSSASIPAATTDAYNAAIRAASIYYDALADVGANANLGGSGAYANLTYFADGSHPTQVGHDLIRDIVSPVVASLMV